MTLINFTHANTLKEALIVKEQIFGFTYSDSNKCYLLYSNGGAVFPVRESKEQIINLLNGEKKE